MKIYVAGPYSSNSPKRRQMNVDVAISYGMDIMGLGHTPYIPHLFHYAEIKAFDLGYDFDYEHWLAQDFIWLSSCDAIFHFRSSPGADRELEFAKEKRLQIFYNLDEIPLDK